MSDRWRKSNQSGDPTQTGSVRGDPTVSVIIPTLNESGNLPYVLNTIPSWVDEVIIVDGRSSDDTERVARALRADVRIIEQRRPGKGAALQAGFGAATGRILIALDADGSMDGAEIGAFRDALVSGADYVKGCRFCPGGGSNDITWFRRLGDRGICWLIKLLFGAKYVDATYGYIGFWSDQMDAIGIDTDGFGVETLIGIRAYRAGLRTAEVPCFEAKRIYGKSNLSAMRDGLRIIRVIVEERLHRHRVGPRHETVYEVQRLGERKGSAMVAGPGSSLTLPGIIVSEIARTLSGATPVVRIEVDADADYAEGLTRSPSLSAAFVEAHSDMLTTRRAPMNARLRRQAFEDWLGPDIRVAFAYAWPGLDNAWIRDFVRAAKAQRVPCAVAVASLPKSDHSSTTLLADFVSNADLVLVGDALEASDYSSAFAPGGPIVEVHRSLSLKGRADQHSTHRVTAFLPKDSIDTLTTLLSAFDAIPHSWIGQYELQIAMRYTSQVVPEMVAGSFHGNHVRLLDERIADEDMMSMCEASSALIIADPLVNSRVFQIAVECGIATIVLSPSDLPDVGVGYVGGLLADINFPAAIDVALAHALRLAELRFPSPDSWAELAQRLNAAPLIGEAASGETHLEA